MTRRYPFYKDSGVEWLGEVPEGWVICTLGLISRSGMGQTILREMLSDVATVETLPVYSASESLDIFGHFTNPSIRLEYGDIIVGARGSIGLARFVTEPSTCTQTTIWLRLDRSKVDPHFVYWVLIGGREQLFPFDKTAIPMLTTEQVRRGRLVLPSLPEQTAIAAFLDEETAKIDALVEEQRRLIVLLREKRQAVISHAVTRGLNTSVMIQDTGNIWLGRVPSGWTLARVKHIKAKVPNAFVDGPFGSNLKSEHYVDDGDVYVIESGFATQGSLDANNLKTITDKHFQTVSRSEACEGDIIIAKIGAYFGKAAILPRLDKPAVVSGNSLKLTVDQTVYNLRFALWYLTSMKDLGVIDDVVNSTAQPALSLGSMNDLPVLLPPLQEQAEIVAYLDKVTAQLDTLTSTAETAIALLQERRTALISAAVTGKIDVRNLVPQETEAA